MRVFGRHAATVALGALGSLVVHQVAYVVAFPVAASRANALGDHSHLPTQWSVVIPLALVAAVALVLRQARGLGLTSCPRRLTLMIMALFVAQESLEALAIHNHGPPPWANAAVYVGLAMAPLAALAIDRFLRQASSVVARWLFGRRSQPALRRTRWSWPALVMPAAAALTGPSPRGPPLRRVPLTTG